MVLSYDPPFQREIWLEEIRDVASSETEGLCEDGLGSPSCDPDVTVLSFRLYHPDGHHRSKNPFVMKSSKNRLNQETRWPAAILFAFFYAQRRVLNEASHELVGYYNLTLHTCR
ncbi:unnamed protein product [Protopolystoma xenopodis]|uniref:Uncharacterized protein n=1 Tax=Protopolystoma xenopodis TaxID=117903 RepID=A0A448WFA1_9PLAT|nr:unnamed protein product [Protopolystoma xenopodis]